MKTTSISVQRLRPAKKLLAALALVISLLELAAVSSSCASESAGEFVISVFTGIALTQNNDLRLK